MYKIVGAVLALILVSAFGFVFLSNKQTVQENSKSQNSPSPENTKTSTSSSTDIQASFAIFTNGTFRVFTAPMYHNLSQDVYIETRNPNIAQVKKSGITWGNFFSTLPFSLTSECLITGTKETFCTSNQGALQFYINGIKNSDALNQEIKAGDKLLVTFGKESEAEIQKQIDRVP